MIGSMVKAIANNDRQSANQHAVILLPDLAPSDIYSIFWDFLENLDNWQYI